MTAGSVTLKYYCPSPLGFPRYKVTVELLAFLRFTQNKEVSPWLAFLLELSRGVQLFFRLGTFFSLPAVLKTKVELNRSEQKAILLSIMLLLLHTVNLRFRIVFGTDTNRLKLINELIASFTASILAP
jgi:hypothetical protein